MNVRNVGRLAMTAMLTSHATAQQFVDPAKGRSPQRRATFAKARAARLEGRGRTVK
jgi:hypothetical protein